jgi:hypothetical protein
MVSRRKRHSVPYFSAQPWKTWWLCAGRVAALVLQSNNAGWWRAPAGGGGAGTATTGM